MEYMGKKWSVNIIRDLFNGKKHFSEFLQENQELSTKMLSARLKELEKNKLIEKRIVSMSPVKIEYILTKKGKALNKILYELAIFSMEQYSDDVFSKSPDNMSAVRKEMRKLLQMEE